MCCRGWGFPGAHPHSSVSPPPTVTPESLTVHSQGSVRPRMGPPVPNTHVTATGWNQQPSTWGTEGDRKHPKVSSLPKVGCPSSLISEAVDKRPPSQRLAPPVRRRPTTGPRQTPRTARHHPAVGPCHRGHFSGAEKEEQVRTQVTNPSCTVLFFLGLQAEQTSLFVALLCTILA